MKIEEKFVETKFGKICYLDSGHGTKTLIFLHGFWGDPLGIKYLATVLEKIDYRIIAPYLPGHGKSFNLPKNFGFTQAVEVLADFIETVSKNNKPIILGVSLGGGLTLGIGNKLGKSKIKGLIVSDPLTTHIGYQQLVPKFIAVFLDRVTDGLASFRNKKIIEGFCADIPKIQKGTVKDLISGMKLLVKVNLKTTSKNMPKTLFLWGDHDRVLPAQKFNFCASA